MFLSLFKQKHELNAQKARREREERRREGRVNRVLLLVSLEWRVSERKRRVWPWDQLRPDSLVSAEREQSRGGEEGERERERANRRRARTADIRHKEKGTQSELGFASVGKFSASERDTCSVLGPKSEKSEPRRLTQSPFDIRLPRPQKFTLYSLSFSLSDVLVLVLSLSLSLLVVLNFFFFTSFLRHSTIDTRSHFSFCPGSYESSQSPLTSTFSEGQ